MARMQVRHTSDGLRYMLWCPGCDDVHMISDGWEFSGDTQSPTFSPSILVTGGSAHLGQRCHSYVNSGRWEFLSDSTHPLAGQSVEMPPLPDWLTDSY
jgi:hypothetical protein